MINNTGGGSETIETKKAFQIENNGMVAIVNFYLLQLKIWRIKKDMTC